MGKKVKENPNHRMYLNILRNMSPEKRLMKALELSQTVRELFREGLSKRFPFKTEEEIKRLYVQQILKCSNLNY